MSEWSSAFDIANRTNYYNSNSSKAVDETYQTYPNYKPETEKVKDNSSLTFDDMLLLMVTQLQNQTIDNQTDTSEMMNQLMQMTVMQALTDVSTQVEELTLANVMSYSASLVGKEVTVGVLDEKGNIQEIVGTVTATGTYDGQQVIFMGDKSYTLNSIMAVGRLPEKVEGDGEKDPDDDKVEGGEDVPGTGDNPDGETPPPVEGSGDAEQTPEPPENNNGEGETGAAGSENGSVAGI